MRVVSLHLRSCRRCAPADNVTPSLGRARRPASELPPLGRHPFPLVGVLVLRTLLSGSSVTIVIRRSTMISDFDNFQFRAYSARNQEPVLGALGNNFAGFGPIAVPTQEISQVARSTSPITGTRF